MQPRFTQTAYWRSLPRWKQTLLRPGNEDLFIYRYFGDQGGSGRIRGHLKDFHYRLIRTALNERRALILYPAGHAKTTLTSTILSVLEICRDPNVRIAICAKNEEEQKGISAVVQAELTDNTLLVRDFGPFKPPAESDKPWSQQRMEIARRTRFDKTPTLLIVPAGSSTLLGTRTDWTICDDVVTDKNSASPTQRENMRNWFDLQVSTGPEHADSRLTVIGTRFDPNDLYGDLEELTVPGVGRIYVKQHEDAITEICNCGHPVKEHPESAACGSCSCPQFVSADWEPLWPEEWPKSRILEKQAEIGILSFNKRYRNIAVDSSRLVVKEEFVRGGWRGNQHYPGCLDASYKLGDVVDNWTMVAGFDPAVGAGRSAKFCAHMVVALGSCRDHERCLWVVDLDRTQLTLPQQVDLILRKHENYGLSKSVVEANSYQMGLYQAVEQKMHERGIAYQVVPHYTNRQNKVDPETGVQAMAPWFEKGQFHIPWGDAISQRKMQVFVDELVQYPGKTTDTVMACWMAWHSLQLARPVFASFNRLDNAPSAVPTQYRRLGSRVIANPAFAKD